MIWQILMIRRQERIILFFFITEHQINGEAENVTYKRWLGFWSSFYPRRMTVASVLVFIAIIPLNCFSLPQDTLKTFNTFGKENEEQPSIYEDTSIKYEKKNARDFWSNYLARFEESKIRGQAKRGQDNMPGYLSGFSFRERSLRAKIKTTFTGSRLRLFLQTITSEIVIIWDDDFWMTMTRMEFKQTDRLTGIKSDPKINKIVTTFGIDTVLAVNTGKDRHQRLEEVFRQTKTTINWGIFKKC